MVAHRYLVAKYRSRTAPIVRSTHRLSRTGFHDVVELCGKLRVPELHKRLWVLRPRLFSSSSGRLRRPGLRVAESRIAAAMVRGRRGGVVNEVNEVSE